MIYPLDTLGAIAFGILFCLGLICAADGAGRRSTLDWLAVVAVLAALSAAGALSLEAAVLAALGG